MEFTTLQDVIEFAIQREDTAARLYTLAAQQSSNIAARKMFEYMAREETGHKDVFSSTDRAMEEQLLATRITDMKIGDYLVDVSFRPDMTYQEILTFAIKSEESASRLYRSAAAATEDARLRNILTVFADVEHGHRLRLEQLYDEHVLTEM